MKFSTSIFIQFISVQAFCNGFNWITSARNETLSIYLWNSTETSHCIRSIILISVASNEKTIENACHKLHLLNTHRHTKQSEEINGIPLVLLWNVNIRFNVLVSFHPSAILAANKLLPVVTAATAVFFPCLCFFHLHTFIPCIQVNTNYIVAYKFKQSKKRKKITSTKKKEDRLNSTEVDSKVNEKLMNGFLLETRLHFMQWIQMCKLHLQFDSSNEAF